MSLGSSNYVGNVLDVELGDYGEWPQAFGDALPVATNLREERMKSPRIQRRIFESTRINVELHVRVEPKSSAALRDALFPEIQQAPEQYVNARLKRQGDRLVIILSGPNISHVRATMNSLLRLITVAIYSIMAVTR